MRTRSIRKGSRVAAVGFALVVVAALVVVDAAGRSGGITGRSETGCTCHASSPSAAVGPAIDGLPEAWQPGVTYDLTVSFAGGPAEDENPGRQNTGGFNLRATAGTLAAMDGTVQVSGEEATHTSTGNDQRAWSLRWTAPGTGGDARFFLATNSVNGNGNNGGDAWNRLSVTVPRWVPPPDDTPPVISGVTAVDATETTVRIRWTTDEGATGAVDYGPTPALGDTVHQPAFGTDHSVLIAGLAPDTEYRFVVRATNAVGLANDAGPFTFRTAPDATPPEVTLLRPRANAFYVQDTEVVWAPLAGHVIGTRLTVRAVATDNFDLARLELLVDGVGHGSAVATTGTDSGTLTFTWNLDPLAVGDHVLSVRATDAAGNVGEAGRLLHVP